MDRIIEIRAREIFDSRGFPTIETRVTTEMGAVGIASVPSGASTGSKEAMELRDFDKNRLDGKGVLKAVENVNKKIGPHILGMDVVDQSFIDEKMIELDGTDNKSKLGANAILSVSLAVVKAAAESCNLPLYRYIGGAGKKKLPVPLVNVINGGKHASNNLNFQEFMIVPLGFETFSQSICAVAEVFYELKKIITSKNYSTAVGDEGGFAPDFSSNEDAISSILESIEKAGYRDNFKIALDCAASEFYCSNRKRYQLYNTDSLEKGLTTDEMIAYLSQLVNTYPIYSIEDPLSEYDQDGWKKIMMRDEFKKIQIVGDDIFVTNPRLIKLGIQNNFANSVLIKLNQIGTLTETINAIECAHAASWKTIISHRSGETTDAIISDLAVALNSGQIKTGSFSRGERIIKYNRLLEISENEEKYSKPNEKK